MAQLATTAETQNVQAVYDLVQAWNDRDPDRYAALLGREFVGEVHGQRRSAAGRAAARAAMQAWLEAFPDLHLTVKETVASGDVVVASWQASGTPQRRLRRPAADARPLEAHGCLVATVRDGAIVHTWTYWDSDQLLQYV